MEIIVKRIDNVRYDSPRQHPRIQPALGNKRPKCFEVIKEYDRYGNLIKETKRYNDWIA